MSTRTHDPVIRTRSLTRHFTRHKQTIEAVRGLDLEVAPGELVAFLGPNGAGKSTTLRMLTTLVTPTAGTAEGAFALQPGPSPQPAIETECDGRYTNAHAQGNNKKKKKKR